MIHVIKAIKAIKVINGSKAIARIKRITAITAIRAIRAITVVTVVTVVKDIARIIGISGMPGIRGVVGIIGITGIKAVFLGILLGAAGHAAAQTSLRDRNDLLLQQLQQIHGLSDAEMQAIRAIFSHSTLIGQGNPAVTKHSATTEQCATMLEEKNVHYANPQFEQICGAKFMAPLYDPATTTAANAKACIDQFEFPDIPCAYPVVWVKAREAAQICEAEGKRLCDAHEWEGACAGDLQPPDYHFERLKGDSPEEAIHQMRRAHNLADEADKTWSYGPEYRQDVCATGGSKTPGCPGGNFQLCGSNTYPAGDFPACHSKSGVYDLNGNAAEHMNLPLNEQQMASLGSTELGYTEMKGSWFIFNKFRAHPDWCRWRAPFWHGTRVMDPHSHRNYHLGFRCCKTLGALSTPAPLQGSARSMLSAPARRDE